MTGKGAGQHQPSKLVTANRASASSKAKRLSPVSRPKTGRPYAKCLLALPCQHHDWGANSGPVTIISARRNHVQFICHLTNGFCSVHKEKHCKKPRLGALFHFSRGKESLALSKTFCVEKKTANGVHQGKGFAHRRATWDKVFGEPGIALRHWITHLHNISQPTGAT